MQEVRMVLNLHGKVHTDDNSVRQVLDYTLVADIIASTEHPHFDRWDQIFASPSISSLTIFSSQDSTGTSNDAGAVETVKSLGPTITCTITAHHLFLIVDDWAGQSFHYCKPVAKFPDDREALREVIREG